MVNEKKDLKIFYQLPPDLSGGYKKITSTTSGCLIFFPLNKFNGN
jgi:hypothetical protein